MEFDFSADEKKILEEVRKFIQKEITPEVIDETKKMGGVFGAPHARAFIRKFAANGWLTPNWPEEYGGLGTSEMVTYMIRDEMTYAGLPLYFVGAHMAGPVIMKKASDTIKKEFLPRISSGEIEFSLGYTEPQAGSDVASLEIYAEDKGDHYLLNGQKMFNTHAHVADYHWLGARTTRDARHKGISLMIVDLKSKGITIRNMKSMAEFVTNEVFYDNVEVPKQNLVGEENKGFYYIMEALDFERMFPPRTHQHLLNGLVNYIKKLGPDKLSPSRKEYIRKELAKAAIEMKAAGLLYYQLPYMLDKGKVPSFQSSMEKMFATEMCQHLTNTGLNVLGMPGLLRQKSDCAPLGGDTEFFYRWAVVETIYAGTSEILRNIIAQRGLGLPR
jgi:3-oxocholest-4-en-26-oyl-CoA dehydrogenase alpha subunit